MTMNEEMAALMDIVRSLRGLCDARKAELAAKKEAFDRENAALISAMAADADSLARAEDGLRRMALAAYAATGSKHPAPGVGIRVSKVTRYMDEAAIAWAIDHGHNSLLKLDSRKFEKVALELGLDFVEFSEVAQATLARDL